MLRSFSLATGELSAITAGILLMLQSCAVSWATQEQLKLLKVLPSELEVVHLGITVCIVWGQSRISTSATVGPITLAVPALTLMMQE